MAPRPLILQPPCPQAATLCTRGCGPTHGREAATLCVARWLWPLGLLLLLALLHACCARAHRLRPAAAWALLVVACAAHGADATPRACALLHLDGHALGSRPLARLCGAAGLALLGLSLYAQACARVDRGTWHVLCVLMCI